MKRLCVIFTFLLLVFAGIAQAQTSDRAGSVGALFLKLGMSPRAAAMGNTYMGISDDITGLFLNPVDRTIEQNKQFITDIGQHLAIYIIDPFTGRAHALCLGNDLNQRD